MVFLKSKGLSVWVWVGTEAWSWAAWESRHGEVGIEEGARPQEGRLVLPWLTEPAMTESATLEVLLTGVAMAGHRRRP